MSRQPAVSGIVAVLGALAVCGGVLLGAPGEWLAAEGGRLSPGSNREPILARELARNTIGSGLRTTDRYRIYRAEKPTEVRGIYVMGSSELASAAPQNPAHYLSATLSDTDLFLSGRGYVQSLPHAIELAAVAPLLEQPRVVLILSPQWFTPEGVNQDILREVYSANLMRDAMSNPRLPTATRDALAARANDLLGEDWSPARQPTIPTTGLLGPAGQLEARLAHRPRELYEVAAAARHQPPVRPGVGPGTIPHTAIPWPQWQAEAEAAGRAAITTNELGIEDGYYARYVAPKLADLKGGMAGVDYSGPSPEYQDLDLFLQVAKDLGIEVLLVSVPMNGPWHDYSGYPLERRTAYYDRIRGIAQRWDVALADFSDEEYTPYFLYDVMHLGWKGWLDVTRACVDHGWAP